MRKMALGYALGEAIYHFTRWYPLFRHGGDADHRHADVESGSGSAGRERRREARKERLREGMRKLSVLPLVGYKSEEKTSRSAECAICLEDFEEDDVIRVVTVCNHAFHVECADSWLKKQQRCPTCRRDI